MKNSLAPSRSVTARDPKGLKFVSIVEAAYSKAGLSEEEAQRVNDTPGLSDLVASFIAENRLTDKFKDEEVKSTYAYPKEYKGPKPIAEQIRKIAEIFDLNPAQALKYAEDVVSKQELPAGAEGWFAIPSIDAIANKHFPEVKDPAERYCRAVQLVHLKIAETRAFHNWRDGEIDTAHLQQVERTVEMLQKIADVQGNPDILIVAAQFGLRHRGRSTRRALEVMATNEFGLGAFAVGCMALTHPERYVRWEELDTDCPGDKFAPGGDGVFSRAPNFYHDDDGLDFDTKDVDDADDFFGSASAFLPQ